jgi:probable rRNA maturation factor
MIEINNLTSAPVDKNFLKKVAGKIIKKEKKLLVKEDKSSSSPTESLDEVKKRTNFSSPFAEAQVELSIALVGPAKIKKLNKEYRKKNKITDVLSFVYNDAAEIVICPQQVKKNAGKYNSTFKKELTRVLIHGILHLLGENHEISKKKAKKMEQKQEYYLNLFLK